MQITPPFGYAAIVPLNRDQRVRLPAPGWVPPALRTSAILPVSVGEFAAAGRDYPIAFIAEAQGFAPVLVVGLAAGDNLFVAGEHWATDVYAPAYLRRFPFCTAVVDFDGETQPDRLICVDKGCLAADGEPLFASGDAADPAVQRWQSIRQMLTEFDADRERTLRLCALLAAHDLLEPFSVHAEPTGGAPLTAGGLLRVAERRLETLPEAVLRELLRSGGMAAIHAHLNSPLQFGRLLDRLAARNPAA
jgi:hypothetical protein